ncbi:hypothetical protein GBF38_002055 [Nibea albiflora]|uniref:Uncharacterized protein n=1 Tax=Nibea albiflora TaxID=240163 RepID=A0ACB7EGI7_NIBAL|nr:hypothetical protein GBF38_002055 [Nibea albiflora]
MFDSILKDLDTVTWKRNLSGPGVVPYGYQQGSLRSRNGSRQLDQNALGLTPSIPEGPLPAEQFTVMDAFDLQLERHDQNTGLHQLNHYMQSGLQQGNFY